MKAFILAAGEGRRMRPLTAHQPKPLLPVNGERLIEMHIKKLAAAGLREIVINVSYLGQMIVDFLGDGERYGVRLAFSREASPLETGGGINCALPLLGEQPFLLVNGDVWSDYPYGQLLAGAALNRGLDGGAHLVLVDNPDHNRGGDFSLRGTRVDSTAPGESGLTYSGIALLSPRLIADYPRRRPLFGLREVFDWAIARGCLSGEHYRGEWLDVGTPERLQALRARLG